VAYQSQKLPVQVSLEAFSPFIPLNSKDSGLPAVIFNFTVTNPHEGAVRVSLLGAQQNLVGWDGRSYVEGVRNARYGGNVNTLTQLQGIAALDMSNPRLEADHASNGRLALAVLPQPGDEITSMTQWESPRQLWDHFSHYSGRLPNQGSRGPSPEGQTWNGALAVKFEVAPKSSRTVTFVLAWHFPNFYLSWQGCTVLKILKIKVSYGKVKG
jgi:non-lysosomal glucosylceramidase